MSKTAEPSTFNALDACHRQIQQHLAQLDAMAQRIAAQGIDDQVRAQAQAIEAFFSGTSRAHHAE